MFIRRSYKKDGLPPQTMPEKAGNILNEIAAPSMSVAIPYHGRVDLFCETLDSLAAQTTKDFEVVVSDDSSPEDSDNLSTLVKEYAKQLTITVIRANMDIGTVANTKQAVDNCSGKCIRILYSGDLITPDTIRLEGEIFTSCPNVLAAFHNASVFKKQFLPNEHGLWDDKSYIDSWLKDKAITGENIFPSGLAFRREMLNFVEFYNQDFPFCYDIEFQTRLFAYSYKNNRDIAEISAGYVGCRISDKQISKIDLLQRWKDSRKLVPVLRKAYKQMSVFRKKELHKKLRKFKRHFDKRLFIEYRDKAKKGFGLSCLLWLYGTIKLMRTTIKDHGRKAKKIRKELAWTESLQRVPALYKENFYYYNWFPEKAVNFSRRSAGAPQHPKVGIVIQGPLADNDFTFETIKMYQNLFNGKNVEIIISTWRGMDEKDIEKYQDFGAHIVLSEPIYYNGRGNVNLQIITTRAGIVKARKLGCDYVLKTRTDQRFYQTDIIEFLCNLLKTFPKGENAKTKERLIALSFNTFKYRFYGVSDMFLFGNIDDVEKYWNIPYDNVSQKKWVEKTPFEIFQQWCPETYIIQHFLKTIGYNPQNTLADSLKMYAEYFCFIDKETVEMFWPKYSNKDRRWNFFEPNLMEEIRFKDWLNLYNRGGIISEWSDKEWDYLPKFDD